MSQRERRQPVYATIRESLTDALDELAVDMKTDPQGVLNDLLDLALDNHALLARSLLKVERRARSLGVVA
jgi:hypothetical protein